MPQVFSKQLAQVPQYGPPYGAISPTYQETTEDNNKSPHHIKEWTCPYWMKIGSYIPLVGTPFTFMCHVVPQFIECWNAWWEGGEAWKKVQTKCSAILFAIEGAVIVAVAVLVWFGYPYISEGYDTFNTLLNGAKNILGKIWGPIKGTFEMVWKFIDSALSVLDPMIERLGINPVLVKVNVLSLFLLASLTAAADAEGILDDFLSGKYGDYGRYIYEVFKVLVYPEREIKKWADDFNVFLGYVVEVLAIPFEAVALLLSVPIALVLYPLISLVEGADRDIKALDPGLKSKKWNDPFKKPSKNNDVVPSGAPERVCGSC